VPGQGREAPGAEALEAEALEAEARHGKNRLIRLRKPNLKILLTWSVQRRSQKKNLNHEF